jgi:hypothetical protein
MVTKRTYKARREKWLRALESGEYKQARRALQKNGGFCCLGVACDLFAKKVKAYIHTYEDGSVDYVDLPPAVRDHLGMRTTNGMYGFADTDGPVLDLMHLNDAKRWSFKQIAAFIRKNANKLFVEGTY